jgi:hypothetical protein
MVLDPPVRFGERIQASDGSAASDEAGAEGVNPKPDACQETGEQSGPAREAHEAESALATQGATSLADETLDVVLREQVEHIIGDDSVQRAVGHRNPGFSIAQLDPGALSERCGSLTRQSHHR